MSVVLTKPSDTNHQMFPLPPAMAFPTRTLKPGDILYEAQKEANLLYLLRTGLLKAIVPSVMGRDLLVDIYGQGDVLGFAALNGGHHAETVVALETASLIPLNPGFVSSDEGLCHYIMVNLARQLARSRQALAISMLPVGARVAWIMTDLSRRFGHKVNGKTMLSLKLSHEDIASLAQSSRVTITRILGELRTEDALNGSRGQYLTDPERLQTAADHYLYS